MKEAKERAKLEEEKRILEKEKNDIKVARNEFKKKSEDDKDNLAIEYSKENEGEN